MGTPFDQTKARSLARSRLRSGYGGAAYAGMGRLRGRQAGHSVAGLSRNEVRDLRFALYMVEPADGVLEGTIGIGHTLVLAQVFQP